MLFAVTLRPRGAQELLAQLPEAPDLRNVEAARRRNAELGTIADGSEAAAITALGYLCLQLPLDLKPRGLGARGKAGVGVEAHAAGVAGRALRSGTRCGGAGATQTH